MTTLKISLGLVAATALVAWWILPSQRLRTIESSAAKASSPVSAVSAPCKALGVASCAATACHGNFQEKLPSSSILGLGDLRPKDSWKTSYLQWTNHDRHAHAFETLENDRSKQIMKLLGSNIPATQDTRCLACHVNPTIASERTHVALELHREGVSCEACHGDAQAWRAPHTSWTAATNREAEYTAHGMTKLYDLGVRAETCAGCHVGAPAKDGVPMRDVNHDLIAAGHPRMNFEYATFLRKMPPHWREKDRTTGAERLKGFEADAWRVGQAVVMEAHLELLKARSSDQSRPWPELAEFNCYACHHDLKPKGWRGPTMPAQSFGTPVRNRPIAMTNPGTDELLKKAIDETNQVETALAKSLSVKSPHLLAKTEEAIKAWKNWRESLVESSSNAVRMRSLFERDTLAWKHLTWDQAADLYRAMVAIENARQHLVGQPNPEAEERLSKLYEALQLPRGVVHFDSPVKYSPDDVRALFQEWLKK
ncbi:MAG: cytochrome c family protein [Planctomycetes bacterium]|nr:cytochrome c family protein [Planctomycetota bacterium]